MYSNRLFFLCWSRFATVLSVWCSFPFSQAVENTVVKKGVLVRLPVVLLGVCCPSTETEKKRERGTRTLEKFNYERETSMRCAVNQLAFWVIKYIIDGKKLFWINTLKWKNIPKTLLQQEIL